MTQSARHRCKRGGGRMARDCPSSPGVDRGGKVAWKGGVRKEDKTARGFPRPRKADRHPMGKGNSLGCRGECCGCEEVGREMDE